MGSGDAFGSGGRFHTCIYVRSDGSDPTRLLIDCGASSLVAMKRFGVETSAIDTILLSHLHGDHFGGLPFFIMESQYVSGRKKPLVLAGPPGLETRVYEAMEVLYPGSSESPRGFDLEFVELANGTTTEIESLAVTPHAVVHPSGAPSYALRLVLEDKVLAYSGDTEWTDALIQTANEADLFICECNFPEKGVPYHLDYETLMDHRTEIGCRRLVLTHMGEAMLRRIHSLDTEGAEDGKSYVL
ncbi:MAG: Ribonuclease Z [uncultured Rubrobacteraceae bacterium]|uniref:Ribonuclease Z n=1 Tax=uncultured Rubrobacteraceae bacterium TaxID=349277 RepID=A0A6J4QUN6_9ACTN|nr:MAG: Ribonuclease Z [uncultured Rubrobacteraceae bacterium]